MSERCPCDLHDREVVFPDCPIANDARAAIALWESHPQRQALAKLLGIHPSKISDEDLRRTVCYSSAHRRPNLQQFPRDKRR